MSVIAIIYTSLVALAQTDMKKLIAYSSVAHMGFVTMGIFAATSRASRARSSRCSATASSRARCSCASA
jgi:NADH:ubiquinone oxidoreductase subunit 4 (subunit M)